MSESIDAIFENGVFRPLVPLNLADRARVRLMVDCEGSEDWLDHDAATWAAGEGDASISLEDVRQRLSTIKGSLADVVIAERGEY